MGLESISEPDDIDMPDDDDALIADGDDDEEDDEDEFSLGNSPRHSPNGSAHGSGVAGSAKSEVDTEDDPIAPLTPSAGKPSFDMPDRMKREASASSSATQDSLGFDDEDDEEWADPPEFSDTHLPLSAASSTSATTSPPPAAVAPAIAPARSKASTRSKGTSNSGKTARRKKNGAGSAKTPRAAPEQVQYPFPGSADPEDEDEPLPPPVSLPQDAGHSTRQADGKRVPQMRTAKARDGGRTQSGGIKGVLMDDGDDF